jgi:PDZ domain
MLHGARFIGKQVNAARPGVHMKAFWAGWVALALCGSAAGAAQAPAWLKREAVPTREAAAFGIRLGEANGIAQPFVIQVDRHSPAWLAGLREGDEILRVQDRPTSSLKDAVRLLNAVPAGRDLRLQVRRGAVDTAVEFASPGGKLRSTQAKKKKAAPQPAAAEPAPAAAPAADATPTPPAAGLADPSKTAVGADSKKKAKKPHVTLKPIDR